MAYLMRGWLANNTKIEQQLTDEKKLYEFTDAFFLQGLIFGRWIQKTGALNRTNGYSIGDMIENPAYVIESILRDWLFVERNRRIDTSSSATKAVLDGTVNGRALTVKIDDYYKYAIWHNHSTGFKTYIAGYDGSTQEVILADADISGAMAAGDWVTITNIQGDNLIDTASFDVVGNTTNGTRDGYQLARYFTERESMRDIIDSICQDFHLFLTKSGMRYRLACLDRKSAVDGVFSNPLKQNGVPLLQVWLSPLDSLYSQYSFKHGVDGRYEMVCSPTGSTYGLGATYEGKCASAEMKYRQVGREYGKIYENIYNGMDSKPTTDTTMHRIAKSTIDFYTQLRAMVEYQGDFKNHIKYEVGDQVKINYPTLIPAGLNDWEYFLIYDKSIEAVNGIPTVRFRLIQI